MKTQTITLYSLTELREGHPEAYKRVLTRWENRTVEPDQDIWNSLAAIRNAAGELTRERSNLTGRRAWAWLENTLLAPHRIPWTGRERWRLAKYGRDYRPERVTPCPFTGVSFDESYLEDIRDSLRRGLVRDMKTGHIRGWSVGQALAALQHKAEALADEGVTYQLSEAAMLEYDDGEEKYTSEGVEWN